MSKYSSLFLLFFLFVFCSKPKKTSEKVISERTVFQRGVATWYGNSFHGKMSASGDTFNTYDFTAAHKKLKFGTLVRVTNTENGKSCVVKINDRGPVSETLLLDLSNAAANELDIIAKGSAKVEIDILTTEENILKKLFEFSRNIGKFKVENVE